MINIKSTNTILYCKKWEETVAFYKALLKLPIKTSLDWFIEFKINETTHLSIADEARCSIDSNKGKGITITIEVDNIQKTHLFLTELGLNPPLIKNHSWGAKIIHVYDPEGNRIEFWASNI
jgi:predicted enzyme related to lactoylglutathione lyase